jgi:hypothetical protein
MSESNNTNTIVQAPQPERISPALWLVRYGIGILMVAGGIVLLIVSPAGTGVDGFAMAVGGGLSVLTLNALYRLSVSSDKERERHEEEWRYFEQHGEWPEDPAPRKPHKRHWVLPQGAVTFEAEQTTRAAQAESAPTTRAAEA